MKYSVSLLALAVGLSMASPLPNPIEARDDRPRVLTFLWDNEDWVPKKDCPGVQRCYIGYCTEMDRAPGQCHPVPFFGIGCPLNVSDVPC